MKPRYTAVMRDDIVKFEIGALYLINLGHLRGVKLTLYLGFAEKHMFYIFAKSRRMYISNNRAIRMAYSLHKLITKVETDVTVTAR